MIEMRALVDNRRYFDRIMHYYGMFSYDRSYNDDDILVEPAKITRIPTQSISALLQALVQYGQQGEKSFLIATHGDPNGLPIRVSTNSAATMNSDFMNGLSMALSGNSGTRQEGRRFAMSYHAGGANVFSNEQQLDNLLGLVRNVRQSRLERLEFRGCNIGAGPALRSVHELLGARITAAPTVQFIWTRLSTASHGTISAQRFAQQLAALPPQRRTFTREECYRGTSPGNEPVIALAIAGDSMWLIARDRDLIKGWTQAYLQEATLFALGREPSGGGYRPGGYMPIVGFLTPTGRYPFVVPGDAFIYTQYLAYEMQAPQWIP